MDAWQGMWHGAGALGVPLSVSWLLAVLATVLWVRGARPMRHCLHLGLWGSLVGLLVYAGISAWMGSEGTLTAYGGMLVSIAAVMAWRLERLAQSP